MGQKLSPKKKFMSEKDAVAVSVALIKLITQEYVVENIFFLSNVCDIQTLRHKPRRVGFQVMNYDDVIVLVQQTWVTTRWLSTSNIPYNLAKNIFSGYDDIRTHISMQLRTSSLRQNQIYKECIQLI